MSSLMASATLVIDVASDMATHMLAAALAADSASLRGMTHVQPRITTRKSVECNIFYHNTMIFVAIYGVYCTDSEFWLR